VQGRIEGRKSADGAAYEIRQAGAVLRAIPVIEAMNDRKLAAAIRRNRWEAL